MAKKKASAKKASSKEARTKEDVGELGVYSVKKKEWVEVVEDAHITKNPNGTYMLRGEDEDGDSVAGIIGEAKMKTLTKQKLARKDF